MSNLEKKNIIVTGASGGIGNAIIKKLNEAGADAKTNLLVCSGNAAPETRNTNMGKQHKIS